MAINIRGKGESGENKSKGLAMARRLLSSSQKSESSGSGIDENKAWNLNRNLKRFNELFFSANGIAETKGSAARICETVMLMTDKIAPAIIVYAMSSDKDKQDLHEIDDFIEEIIREINGSNYDNLIRGDTECYSTIMTIISNVALKCGLPSVDEASSKLSLSKAAISGLAGSLSPYLDSFFMETIKNIQGDMTSSLDDLYEHLRDDVHGLIDSLSHRYEQTSNIRPIINSYDSNFYDMKMDASDLTHSGKAAVLIASEINSRRREIADFLGLEHVNGEEFVQKVTDHLIQSFMKSRKEINDHVSEKGVPGRVLKNVAHSIFSTAIDIIIKKANFGTFRSLAMLDKTIEQLMEMETDGINAQQAEEIRREMIKETYSSLLKEIQDVFNTSIAGFDSVINYVCSEFPPSGANASNNMSTK